MKLPTEETQNLISVTHDYFAPENDAKYEPRFPRNRRQFYTLVGKQSDHSFITLGAAVKLQGSWYLNSAGVARWVEYQANKALGNIKAA